MNASELDRRRALWLLIGCAAAAGCRKKRRLPAPAAARPGAVETGIASWYGHPYHGRRTASGEIYDMEKLTAAHRTLPFGTWVEVTNLDNRKRVRVRITDRGPFVDGRIIDLSLAAAREIDMVRAGIVKVRVQVVSGPAAAGGRFAVQVGAYLNRDNAERMRRRLQAQYRHCRLVKRDGPTVLWRVLIGEETSEEQARILAAQLRPEFGAVFVVRLDEPSGDEL
ncbi:MAG: septal ring lytic transglycosylase RlpA family protein [Bryobacteraceae bacterium]|nr:septal ring lytic transglycosylase RlpA family protein [Bryobacteraceae bacterium]